MEPTQTRNSLKRKFHMNQIEMFAELYNQTFLDDNSDIHKRVKIDIIEVKKDDPFQMVEELKKEDKIVEVPEVNSPKQPTLVNGLSLIT